MFKFLPIRDAAACARIATFTRSWARDSLKTRTVVTIDEKTTGRFLKQIATRYNDEKLVTQGKFALEVRLGRRVMSAVGSKSNVVLDITTHYERQPSNGIREVGSWIFSELILGEYLTQCSVNATQISAVTS